MRNLISSIIHSDQPLDHLTVTTKWQLGLVSVGSGPMFKKTLKDRLETRYYRCAIRRMTGDSDGQNKKFLVWCLDETKYCLHWVTSLGPVYHLPDQLQSTVMPWLARHIWFDSKVMKDLGEQILNIYIFTSKFWFTLSVFFFKFNLE